jgi:hypothetical protein
LEALREGHCFIAFDLFCDSSGFNFSAGKGSERMIQGDEVSLSSETHLSVNTPVNSRIVLIKNGNGIQERSGVSKADFVVTEKGAYRVEVYLPQLPKPLADNPWIISNPIYVH